MSSKKKFGSANMAQRYSQIQHTYFPPSTTTSSSAVCTGQVLTSSPRKIRPLTAPSQGRLSDGSRSDKGLRGNVIDLGSRDKSKDRVADMNSRRDKLKASVTDALNKSWGNGNEKRDRPSIMFRSQEDAEHLNPEKSDVRPRTLSTLLPPRRLSSLSSTCFAQGQRAQFIPVSIQTLHFAHSYTPHKSVWLKNALENLGGSWVREGKITNEQLTSAELEENMSVLYDLAMARKHQAIDRLVDTRKGSNKSTEKRNHNFPFAQHLNEDVKDSMSNSLFRILMREPVKTEDRGDGVSTHPVPEVKKPETEESCSSNSFEKTLTKRRSLVPCYVIEGKLVVGTKDRMISVGGSVVNKFGESSSSRARQPGSSSSAYFRATANMMGFEPCEVSIRYCKNSRQLIVSGSRSKRDRDNARQVREVIEVPKGVDVASGLAVLRTGRGSLIIEEVI